MEPNLFLLLNRCGWLFVQPQIPRYRTSPRVPLACPSIYSILYSARGIPDCGRLWKPRKLFPPDLRLPHNTHPPWPHTHTHTSSMPTSPMKGRSPGWPGTQDARSPNCWDYKGEPSPRKASFLPLTRRPNSAPSMCKARFRHRATVLASPQDFLD